MNNSGNPGLFSQVMIIAGYVVYWLFPVHLARHAVTHSDQSSHLCHVSKPHWIVNLFINCGSAVHVLNKMDHLLPIPKYNLLVNS